MVSNLGTFLLSIRNRHFFVLDLAVFAITPVLATALFVNHTGEVEPYLRPLLFYTVIFMCCKPLVCWALGLYDRFWPYPSENALRSLAGSAIGMLLLELSVSYGLLYPLLLPTPALPRSIPVMSAFMSILFVGATRVSVRLLFKTGYQKHDEEVAKPVVIAGAGIAGSIVVELVRMNPQLGLRPVAFVDDDPRKLGARIDGVLVAGSLADLSSVVQEFEAQEVIIAIPSAPAVIDKILQTCDAMKISRRIVPGALEMVGGDPKLPIAQTD